MASTPKKYRLERLDGRPGKEMIDPRTVEREGIYGSLGSRKHKKPTDDEVTPRPHVRGSTSMIPGEHHTEFESVQIVDGHAYVVRAILAVHELSERATAAAIQADEKGDSPLATLVESPNFGFELSQPAGKVVPPGPEMQRLGSMALADNLYM